MCVSIYVCKSSSKAATELNTKRLKSAATSDKTLQKDLIVCTQTTQHDDNA